MLGGPGGGNCSEKMSNRNQEEMVAVAGPSVSKVCCLGELSFSASEASEDIKLMDTDDLADVYSMCLKLSWAD